MNRLAKHIAGITVKTDALDADAYARLDAEMALDPGEHFAYQQEQARAHASGKLTADEAMIVYTALGEVGSTKNGGWAADTKLPTKVSVTLLMGELIRSRIGIRAAA